MSWWDSSTSTATRLVRSPSLFLIPFCVAYLVYFGWFVTRLGGLINRDLQLVEQIRLYSQIGSWFLPSSSGAPARSRAKAGHYLWI